MSSNATDTIRLILTGLILRFNRIGLHRLYNLLAVHYNDPRTNRTTREGKKNLTRGNVTFKDRAEKMISTVD